MSAPQQFASVVDVAPEPAGKVIPTSRMKHGFGAWFFGLHLGGGVAVQRPDGALVLGFEAAHLCWRDFYWSVFEGFMGITFPREPEYQDDSQPGGAPRFEFLTAGTRVGYPLLLGPNKHHELRFGVGFAGAILGNLDEPEVSSFVVIPGIRYQISAFIASFQVILPTIYDKENRYPASFFLTVGISLFDHHHL